MTEKKPPICIDFDGVLNTYKGWNGQNELYTPRPGAKEFLNILTKKYEVIIFSARDNNKVREWLDKHGMVYDKITNIKIPAVAYVDDRAIKFEGSFLHTLSKIYNFKTHWEEDVE